MNGEVNGTMDKPVEASIPSPPDNLQDEKKDASEGCDNGTTVCENGNNTEDSNHLDSENSQECITICKPENSENDVSNGSDSQKHAIKTSSVSEHENSNNMFLENNSGNSNESYPESVNSSHTLSETTEQIIIQNIDEKSKDESPERKFATGTTSITQITQIDENSDEIDTDDSSVDVFEGEPRAEDTVSINSDSDPEGADDLSQEGVLSIKRHNIIILENENEGSSSVNENSHGTPSPEVQEILSDNDDVILADDKSNTNDSDIKIQLRRSSRAIKRKRYNDNMENGDHNAEDVPINANFLRKNSPIVINDTKVLADMAAKQMKSSQYDNQKSEPTVVIIDTMSSGNTEKSSVPRKHTGTIPGTEISAQNYYKSLQLRGTTVTPVSTKSNASTQSSQTSQPSILPSLTDDMFVVEAPSFIVPYVYEKPSVKPFREFVDLLGKELDEKKAKEEKEKKLKEEKEKRKEKIKQENMEKGEDDDADEESSSHMVSEPEPSEEKTEEKKKKKKDKRRRGDEDDASWDGETSTDSEDEILMSDEEDKTIIIKDKVDAINQIKSVSDLTADKVCSTKSDNYFDCSLGKFFINIGLSLVQEYVQSDLLKQQNRKLNREKKTGVNTKSTEQSIASLMKNLELSKETNVPYSFPQSKCEFCSFKTESKLAMSHHLETPHMKNNVYKCNFCTFEIRSPHDILFHMEAEHNIRGRLERAPAYHQCANCPFEDNGKGKLARHLIPCAKKFKPDLNLAPPLEWEPPAKIPKITRSRNNMLGSYQNTFNRNNVGNNVGRPSLYVSNAAPGASSYRPRGRTPMPVAPRPVPVHGGASVLRGGVMVRHNTPVLMSSNYSANNTKQKSVHQPSISITPLPRQPQPVQLPQPSHNSKSTFVICEICDGYIKDLDQLRNHMQWIHKVKIHPKMIYNRPPLNCQKCQFRFFTDQGLERHLLGSHGLVTSSMQEAANKGKDAGRCPVCGRVYQWKLLNHVARDHNLTLKPAHLSYKCTVCTATFGMYKQFENHVYSAHSVVAKRVMDKSKGAAPVKTNRESLLKPLKINEEITIIPQPVKVAPAQVDDEH